MDAKKTAEDLDSPMLSERVRREMDELLSASPRVDTDKLKIELEVYKGSEAESPAIRRARVFERLCREKPLFIDNNPIAGTISKYKYGSYFLPFTNFRWVRKEKEFALQRGLAQVSEEDLECIRKASDYWDGKAIYDETKRIILKSLDVDISVLGRCGVGLNLADNPNQDPVPDYFKLLNKGLKGILADIEEQRSKVDIGGPEGLSKLSFYEASEMSLEGMIHLARRYASLAGEMAERESDHERRRELKRISETCLRVPAEPARSFREAIQSVWFVIMGVWMETPLALFSPPGRFTQYMFPFYKKDREEGRITDEEVIELLHFFFLKINGLASVLSPNVWAWNQSRLGMQLTLGGIRPDGGDATNDLDFLVLEAQQRIRLPEPLVNVVYHDGLSSEFLTKCVDLIRTGIGQPAFHDVRKAVDRHLLYDKAPLEMARNVGIAGCLQSLIPGYSDFYWEARFNIAKMVELALNDGRDALQGVQLGPHTGDAVAFETYDDFYQAFLKQLRYFIPLVREISRVHWNVTRRFPIPFGSAFVNDCIEKGLDMGDGGGRYSVGDGQCYIGGIDAANSLAAIKRLVFEERKIPMSGLKEALAADFEGYEEIQKLCFDAPKYGNDDEYVDSIAKDVYESCYQEHSKIPDYLGRDSIQAAAYSVTSHWGLGRFTAALPNGRKAATTLTDASVSAQPGTDKHGPTALARSAARVIDTVKFNSNHLNMKLHPTALKGVEGANKFLSLIKTYFDSGGYHIQFNCVSGETLKDAQIHPDKYRNLVVRVAGFSAFFIHLERAMQDEIISRTEIGF